MENFSNFLLPGIIFVLTLASGFWLSSLGQPLNGILFTVHKLIALGAVVLTTVQIFAALKGLQIQALPVALLAAAGMSGLALFASGALMSAGKLSYVLMLTIHRVAPWVLAICLPLSIYLLIGKKL